MKIYEIFEDEIKYYIVIELMRGKTLFEQMQVLKAKQLTEGKVANLIRQVLSGLNCCHTQGIAHRDIKPENLMFADKESTTLKLIDFGFAKFFKAGECKFKEILGSPMYMAPEILTQDEYDEKCDIWSTGILCYSLLCGEMPFQPHEDDPLEVLLERIRLKVFTKSDMSGTAWQHISNEAKDFVLMLLEKDPEKRPSAKEMLGHIWLSVAKDENLNVTEAKKAMERLLSISVFFIKYCKLCRKNIFFSMRY